jgi:hypothetical protein
MLGFRGPAQPTGIEAPCACNAGPLPKKVDGLDLAQWPFLSSPNIRVMNKPDEVDQGKPRPKPSRSEDALRIIEEYVNDLREIIKKLRRRLN